MRKGILLLLVFTGVSQAEVYRWTDEKGQVHFGDKPPAVNDSVGTVDQIDENSLTPDNTFEAQHKNYQGNGTDYRAVEQQSKAERRERRLQKEKQQAAADKKQRQCREARDNYRRYNLIEKRAGSLQELMKQRQQRDRYKDRIKRYCY